MREKEALEVSMIHSSALNINVYLAFYLTGIRPSLIYDPYT